MADYDSFRIPLLDEEYPATYDLFVSELEARAQEQEDARQGQANLLANLDRYVMYAAATANLNMANFKITSLGTPTTGTDAVNKTYADGLSFTSALPDQTGNDDFVIRTSGGTASWGNWWGTEIALTGAGTLVKRKTYHADSSGGAFTVNLPPAADKVWVIIRDVALACAQNPITLVPDGTDKIYGSTQNYVMDVDGESLVLVVDPTKGWVRA